MQIVALLSTLVTLIGLGALLTPAHTQQCCVEPSFELSSAQGRATLELPYGQTVTRFQQTLGDISGSVFNGNTVNEASSYAGTDGCWYSGAPFPPTSTVTGGHWIVAQNYFPAVNGTNQWGYDYNGFTSARLTGFDATHRFRV